MKKGVSSVVATVLILLLTVAAVTTLSSIVIPFVKQQLYSSTDCTKYKDSFEFVENLNGNNYNCYKYDNNMNMFGNGLIIKSKDDVNKNASTRGGDENIKGFLISFQSDKGSEIFEINRTSKDQYSWMLGNKDTSVYDYPAPGEIITYGFYTREIYNKAEIRAVLKDGTICEKTDDIEISECVGVDILQ